MDGGLGGVSGEGGASAQGPSTGTTYKFGVRPGEGANREDIGGKRKRKKLPSRPQSEQDLPANERVRPRRKPITVSGGTTFPSDSAR